MNPLERWLHRLDLRLARFFAYAGLFYLICAVLVVAALVLVNAITG